MESLYVQALIIITCWIIFTLFGCIWPQTDRYPLVIDYEISDEKFCVSIVSNISSLRQEFPLSYFATYVETENLFIISDAGDFSQVIPKRFFATQADMTASRAILHKQILERSDKTIDATPACDRTDSPVGSFIAEGHEQFAIEHGVERHLFYDPQANRFFPSTLQPDTLCRRLFDDIEWAQMLQRHGLRIVNRTGWRWKGDPEPPPWRAYVIVAAKQS